MSERILKALMQLFAIIAKVDLEEVDGVFQISGGGRDIVRLFLKQELNQELVDEYLKLFDEFLAVHQGKSKKKDGKRKRTSVNSVKVLRICTQINEELTQKQKLIVLIRILEFIYANGDITEQELEFATTVADTFNISQEEYERCKRFVELNEADEIDDASWMFVNANEEGGFKNAHHLCSSGIEGRLVVIRIESVNIFFMRYQGKLDLYLNGQVLPPERNFILNQGSSIRSSKVSPIYYSDIISRFLSDQATQKISFRTDAIQYHFKGGKVGLHPINFAEDSGKLIGIMGGSGAGKSTLLNVLNGNYTPTVGAVTINGVDIHRNADAIEGLIGYVSQDDLLIEELTVFQNLFYNAKLCFGSLSDSKITRMVLQTLSAIGLSEAKDLKVGSPLEKTISGGQRKRLNIALELIREPAVMFVDEPTSGLSSRDSENIMDLLKELALKGKLIFVVIHQPSSDIFKMFDTLLILDQGGYPIYNGNPVDAVVYFKKLVQHVNADESECPSCGNVNPEQIFNIIESKVVDEYGNLTRNRKVSPKEWNQHYKKLIDHQPLPESAATEIPESEFKVPSKLSQFKVFFKRDVLSKLTNSQYMMINLLEAPALAAILAFFMKYFGSANEGEYVFRYSENIPQFLFISVIVALFIGLTVSAEEIIGNQKILKREEFLNLSKGSYLTSKVSIMFIISAVQMLLFVVVGNLILEIKGMTIPYWIVLFSTSCFANVLGLNISASFNSAKVIYILIPILIIPQLLFSGIIVSFDKLNPMFKSESHVPWIGNVMASRWAYEALSVYQFQNNSYERQFFKYDKNMKFANWKKDHWIPALDSKINRLHNFHKDSANSHALQADLDLVRDELEKEKHLFQNEARFKQLQFRFDRFNELQKVSQFNENLYEELKGFLVGLKEMYKYEYKVNEDIKDSLAIAQKTPDATFMHDLKLQLDAGRITKEEYRKQKKQKRNELNQAVIEQQNLYTNNALSDFVTNSNSFTQLVEAEGQLIQKSNPIYLDPYDHYFLRSHFYAPRKKLFGTFYSTFFVNVLVIWFMTFILIITLHFDALRKLLGLFGRLTDLIPIGKKGR